MRNDRKANLFVVGAMKAGTSSFYDALAKHPEIYVSPIKEPNYFVDELPKNIYKPSAYFSLNNYFKNEFPKPLHVAHVRVKHQYDHLFSGALASHKCLADGSTAYFHAPETPEKIYSYNPNARIIIVVRNGLNRALSHYKMNIGLGRTTFSFENELKKDLKAFENGTLGNWSYLGMSLYAENIQYYRQIFGKNVLVINFEEMISKVGETFKKVFEYLELDYFPVELLRNNESFNIRLKKEYSGFIKPAQRICFPNYFRLRYAMQLLIF